MNLADIPSKFNIPFASSAGGGFIRTIPQVPTGTPGQASLQTGFPPENFEPVAAGGVPPFGADFNGLLNQMSAWDRWAATGGFPPYDAVFQAAVGGYPKTAIVQSLVDPLLLYESIVDGNLTNPDNGGAGWIIWFRKQSSNVDIYVNVSTGNDANNGLSPATALATTQAAVNLAWTWPPSQYIINIHIAAGTYTGGMATPLSAGPSLNIVGAGIGSTILDGGSGNFCFNLQGPNTATISGLTARNTAPTGAQALFTSGRGATLTIDGNSSTNCGGAVMQATRGGNILVGNHTFSGNAYALFWANASGELEFLQSKTLTIGANITMALATTFSAASSSILIPGTSSPVWSLGAFAVTGSRYLCSGAAGIIASGLGTSWFPGSSPGTLDATTYGWYSP